MGGLFGKTPSIPAPVTPPAPLPAPTIDAARQSQQARDMAASRRGRASDILTSTSGDLSSVNTASKTLLGS